MKGSDFSLGKCDPHAVPKGGKMGGAKVYPFVTDLYP